MAGGCLVSQYLAPWMIIRLLGEHQQTVERALGAVHAGEAARR